MFSAWPVSFTRTHTVSFSRQPQCARFSRQALEPEMSRSRLFSLLRCFRSCLRPFVLALGLVRKNNTVLVLCRSRSYFISISVFFVVYSQKDLSSHLQIIDFQSCQENQFFTGGASPEPPAGVVYILVALLLTE